MTSADDATRAASEQFEDEVRRIARQLWPGARFSGAAMLEGRERDAVFETEECIHIVEATTSRKKEKAQSDVSKLAALAGKLQRKTTIKAVRGWLVTRDEPTADQRRAAERHRPVVTILSFGQFQSLLIDSRAYLTARDNYVFGSVRDPATGAASASIEYVELLLSNVAAGEVEAPIKVATGLRHGGRYVILGDYGAGKSMTLRWIYRELRAAHFRRETSQFPVYVNLRDHYGQSDPGELLERHARIIGCAEPSHLVRAWRAGYVHLLLDGFDEITTLHIQGLWRKLQDNRFRAMEVVRKLLREHPSGAGIVLAGRAHFFDSGKERKNALGLTSGFVELSLNDFTDEQIRDYFQKSGFSGPVPPWLPSRPLLVAYLAARGLLPEVLSGVGADEPEFDPARGWDTLLDRITSREAEIEAGIDGPTVRRILERLATKARGSPSGLGPLSADNVVEAFRQVCGYSPDERGMVLLQRLPGLGIDREEEGTRAFIDEDFAEACRAGDIVRLIERPFDFEPSMLTMIECATGALGIAVASSYCISRSYSSGKIDAAIRRAQEISPGYVPADIARVAMDCGLTVEHQLYIRDVYIPELEFTSRMGNMRRVEFQDCFFSRVGMDPEVDAEQLPRFKGCFIDEIDGRVSRLDLPTEVFDEGCVVESFATAAATTDAVMTLDLPLGTRVLLTVLKKLYQRRGSGRKENALFRGLDHHARRLVPDVLRLIQREGLAAPFRRGEVTIWIPDRSSMRRVGKLIAAPTLRDDPLLKDVAAIG